MTKMATMPIYGKNLKKSSSPEPIDRWPWNLVCSIAYASTTKIVQIISLGWPWSILLQDQIWSQKLLYGEKVKIIYFLETIAALGVKSCLMHSAKWVYEVGLVSKIKVILCPWSKVTQISKLKLVSSETILRFETKVHMKAWGKMGMKIYMNELCHMTKMATMPIYGKNL